MPNAIEQHVADIREACRHEPINWAVIRNATSDLSRAGQTADQQSAIKDLARATYRHAVERAANAIERAFLDGTPGADGWPRRF